MSFNDYLKYVKGHAIDSNGVISFIDRFITAIDRRTDDSDCLVSVNKINFNRNYNEATMDVLVNNNRKYKIYVDLYNTELSVATVVNDFNKEEFEDFSRFIMSKGQTKTKIKMDLTGIIDPLFIYNDDDEEYVKYINIDEAVKYVKDGINTIGKENVKINLIIIFIIKILEALKAFEVLEGEEIDDDIPEEYQSSEPGEPAHKDDGNTKADSSANSMI